MRRTHRRRGIALLSLCTFMKAGGSPFRIVIADRCFDFNRAGESLGGLRLAAVIPLWKNRKRKSLSMTSSASWPTKSRGDLKLKNFRAYNLTRQDG